MGKYDAEARQARGEPIPEHIQGMLNQLVEEESRSVSRHNLVRQRAVC